MSNHKEKKNLCLIIKETTFLCLVIKETTFLCLIIKRNPLWAGQFEISNWQFEISNCPDQFEISNCQFEISNCSGSLELGWRSTNQKNLLL